MAGFTVNGIDLDTLFEPIGATSKIADVGYTTAGSDISNFYADASLGTPYGTTNFRTAGTDIGTLFAAYGSLGPVNLFLYSWGQDQLGQLGILFPEYSWSMVSAGSNSVAAIRNDGILFTWGYNHRGQLGIGNTITRSAPQQVGNSTWIAVSVGGAHMLGITSSNNLFVWGYGSNGRLGINATTSRSSPTLVAGRSWVSVSAGGAHSAGITTTGALFTWGWGDRGRLGLGISDTSTVSRSSPVQVGTSSWTSVSTSKLSSEGFTTAIRNDGALFTWGSNVHGQTGVLTDSYSWNMISGGGRATFGIRNDGLLFSWGQGTYGLIGNNSTFSRSAPTQIGTSSWTSVSATSNHVMAIRTDGALFAWGDGSSGRLGLATTASPNTINRSSPVQVGTSSWTAVANGNTHTVAIRSDGALFTWGAGTSGRLGLNDTLNRSSPSQVGASNWTQVSAGYFHTAALRTDGGLFTWGMNNNGILGLNDTINRSNPTQVGTSSWSMISAGGQFNAAIRIDGGLFTWGYGSSGRLGLATTASPNTINRSNPTQVGTSSWTSVSAGATHTVAILSNGALFSWGGGSTGRLGLNDTLNRSSPVQIGTSSWTSISATKSFGSTFAIDNNNVLFSWGSGLNGILGNGTTFNRSNPIQIGGNAFDTASPVQLGTSSWTMVSAGATHTAAIRSDGSLFTWGMGTSGRLGLNDTISRSIPSQVGISSWAMVSAGSYHTAAVITAEGNQGLFTWGGGGPGLGLNNTLPRSSPTAVGFPTMVSQISSGQFNTLMITSGEQIGYENKLWTWGQGTSGRLGLNSTTDISTPVILGGTAGVGDLNSPVQVGTSTMSWNSISVGARHSAAINSDGLLFTWGYNFTGQLGVNDNLNRSSPIQIGASSWTAVSVGYKHTAAIRADGALFTWGQGSSGRLGLNTIVSPDTINRSSPVQVGTSSWTAVAAGFSHTVAIREDGGLFTWGGGTISSGELGLDDTIRRSSPVQVGTSSWTSVSAGQMFTAAIRVDGALFTWGMGNAGILGTVDQYSWTQVSSGYNHTAGIRNDGILFTWGNGSSGRLGVGIDATGTVNRSSPTQIGTSSWTSVSAGYNYTTAIRADGGLFTWGASNSGQTGLNDTINRSSPVQVGTSSWTTVNASTFTHTLAIRTDGALFTWGLNTDRQLGLGSTLSTIASPNQVGTSSWTAVSGGSDFSAAIDINGSLYTWGRNAFGLLGLNDTINRSLPTQLGTSSWTSVSAGSAHSAAIRIDGGLFTWGVGSSGRLGVGIGATGTIDRSNPTQVGTSSWTSVSAGRLHTMAVRIDGALFSWGSGSSGRLGNNSTIDRSSPVQIGTDSWTSVSAGAHSAAINNSFNALYTWGGGASGQLGFISNLNRSSPVLIGVNIINRSSPVQVGNSSWLMISAGAAHVAGITQDKKLFTWGAGGSGRLGDGQQLDATFPTQIGSSSWTMVSAGGTHTAAIRSDGGLFTWGSGVYGRLGISSTNITSVLSSRSSPTQVGTKSWSSVGAGYYVTSGLSKFNSL